MPRPAAVIVAGLGQEGKLQRRRPRADGPPGGDRLGAAGGREQDGTRRRRSTLAATLLGSGGTGITAGQAAQLIAQGVHEANELLRPSVDDGQRVAAASASCGSIELYLDRATEAWRALKMQARRHAGRATTSPSRSSTRHRRAAAAARLRLSRRRLRLHHRRDASSDERRPDQIAYTLDTRRARSRGAGASARRAGCCATWSPPRRATRTDDRRSAARSSTCWSRSSSKPFLAGTRRDADRARRGHRRHSVGAARHRSDAHDVDRRPWAIRSKLLRKLRTEDVPRRRSTTPTSSDACWSSASRSARPTIRGCPARAWRHATCSHVSDVGPNALGAARVTELLSADDQTAAGPDARTVDRRAVRAQPGASSTSPGTASCRREDGGTRRRGAVERHVPRPRRDQSDARRARAGVRQLLPSGARDVATGARGEAQRGYDRVAFRVERRRGS